MNLYEAATQRFALPRIHVHKATRQHYVRIDGRCVYLGRDGSDRVIPEYLCEVGGWLYNFNSEVPRGNRRSRGGVGLTVDGLVAAYAADPAMSKRLASQTRSAQWTATKAARMFCAILGRLPASRLSRGHLAALQWAMDFESVSNRMVYDFVRSVARIIRWGIDSGLVKAEREDFVCMPNRFEHPTESGFAAALATQEERPDPRSINLAARSASPTIRLMLLTQFELGLHAAELVALRVEDCEVLTFGCERRLRVTTRPVGFDPLRDATCWTLPQSTFVLSESLSAALLPLLVHRSPTEFVFSPRFDLVCRRLTQRQKEAIRRILATSSEDCSLPESSITSTTTIADFSPNARTPARYSRAAYEAMLTRCVEKATSVARRSQRSNGKRFRPWRVEQLWQPRLPCRSSKVAGQRIVRDRHVVGDAGSG